MAKPFIVEVYPEVGMLGEPNAVTVPINPCPACKTKNSLVIMNIEFKPKFANQGIVYCRCLFCEDESTAYVRDMKGIMIGEVGKEAPED